MKISTKWLGMAAVAACASFTLSSCGGSGGSSSSSSITLPTMENMYTIVLQDDDISEGVLQVEEFIVLSTTEGEGMESGTVRLCFIAYDSTQDYNEAWFHDENVSYTYDSSSGVITFAGGTAVNGETGETKSFDSFSMTLEYTSDLGGVSHDEDEPTVTYQSYAGYCSACTVTFGGKSYSIARKSIETYQYSY